MNRTKYSKIGFVFGTALLGALTGCIGYVDGPPQARVYAQPQPVYVQPAPPPPVYVESPVVVPDNYVYYPDYQVYYSGSRRQYVYLDGSAWVTRPSPRVSVDLLFASPSVRLGFHDSPASHHAAVVRQYPKHWAPPGSDHGYQQGHNDRN
jgi:hypothetical protein